MKYESLDLAVQAWFENTLEYDPLFAYNIISAKLSQDDWDSVYRDLIAIGAVDVSESGNLEPYEIEELLEEYMSDYDRAMFICPKLDWDDWESVGRDLIAIGVIEVNDEGDEYVVNA